jgi:glyoxylase-like metal-dependent hydrolase (beta-lactamase superfamily II)
MFRSLQKLASLPDSTVVYPGHRYSVPSAATLEAVKEINYALKPRSLEEWLSAFA